MTLLVPKMTRTELLQKIAGRLDPVKEKVCIIGIRGYYANTYGRSGVNDRGFYDDAIFVLTDETMAAFSANTDPAQYRKGIATLLPGLYDVERHRHHGRYDAFQIIKDRVSRDGQPGEIFTGRHGINFHFGGERSTWSEGCQTLRKADFFSFRRIVADSMTRHEKRSVKYLLINA